MTDKEKIKEQANIDISNLRTAQEQGIITRFDEGKLEALEGIVDFIDSMQEEPVSIWHDTSENPKEKEYLICVYKDNRYHIGKTYKDEFSRLLVSDNKNIIELCMFEKWTYLDDILKLSNVERIGKEGKEPVSKELAKVVKDVLKNKESAKKFLLSAGIMDADGKLAEPYRTEETLCEDFEREIHNQIMMLHLTPCYDDLDKFARHFANWQKQQMMAKAVDVEVKVDAGGYPYIPAIELYDYNKDMPLAKEGDKYKVILIKED